jgi:hypothetical protein
MLTVEGVALREVSAMRKWGVVIAVVGLLMLAGAAVLRFVVVPNGQMLPADTAEQIEYAGTLTAVDPAAIGEGDLDAATVRDLPLTVARDFEVLETEGDLARVSDAATVTVKESGEVVSETEHVYTIDRESMHAVPNFTDEPAEEAEGLVVGFPIGAEKLNYVGWVQEIEETARVVYEGETTVQGLTVYEYAGEHTAEVSGGDLVEGAPESLPKEQLVALVEVVGVPAELQEQLTAALPILPDEVPLAYAFSTEDSYVVEPTTGIIVDMTKTTRTSVGMAGFEDVQFPVVETTVEYTPGNVADQAQRAQDALDDLRLFGTTIPLVLAGLGVVALVVSIPMIVRRRRTPEEATPPAADPRSPAVSR